MRRPLKLLTAFRASIAIACEADLREVVERLHDHEEIALTHLLVNEAGHGGANALGALAGAHVVLVEIERDEARAWLPRFALFVGRVLDLARRCDRPDARGLRAPFGGVDLLRDAVVEEREVSRTEIRDGHSLLVSDDGVDAERAGRRIWSGLSRRLPSLRVP